MRYRLTPVAVLLLVACARTETPEQRAARMQADTDSARAYITASMERFQAHMNAGHADSIAPYYAENAVMMPQGMATVTGRDSIRAAFAGMREMMGAGEMHFTVQNVSASGDMAVERGRWHWQPAAGNRSMPADSGKYLVHWHRNDGRWLIVEDIWNSDVMTPPPVRRN